MGKDSNFIYCRPSPPTAKRVNDAFYGIGFGGRKSAPRVQINENLCGRVLPHDDTFEQGNLLPPSYENTLFHFDVEVMEVWGVGDENIIQEALASRNAERHRRTALIEQAQKVDKSQFMDDFKSGFMQSKAFSHY